MKRTRTDTVVCPACGGNGEVPDYSRYGISTRIDPPVKRCAFCNGGGEVFEDAAEEYEEGRDYEREMREEALLARLETRREEGR